MSTNDGRIPGGPTTPDVIHDRQGHISNDIWAGQIDYTDPLRVRYQSQFFSDWDIRGPREALAATAGFGYYQQIKWLHHDLCLCYALAERFWPQTCTFHLPFGEMTITLEDTLHCLGLNITGRPVVLPYATKKDYPSLITECLGVLPPIDNPTQLSNISLTWLRDTFGKLPDREMSKDEVHCYTRAYLLALCGATLFPNGSGKTVNASLLQFFRDLSQTSCYSWGAAVLSYLYHSLGQFAMNKGKRIKRIVGCTPLLQIWAHERLPIGRPVPKKQKPTFPRAYRWMTSNRTYMADPHHSVLLYRNELDFLTASMVVWTPYYPISDDDIEMVITARDYSLHRSCVIFMHIVQYHPVDRCMRQFDLHQTIPGPVHVWAAKGRRATGVPDAAIKDWEERFINHRVIGRQCPNIHASWPSEEFQKWYGCPRMHNPTVQFVEHRYIPRGYVDDLYAIYKDRCYAEAAVIDALIPRFRASGADQHIVDELEAVRERLTLLPPLPLQIPRPCEPAIHVPPRSLSRRQRETAHEEVVQDEETQNETVVREDPPEENEEDDDDNNAGDEDEEEVMEEENQPRNEKEDDNKEEDLQPPKKMKK